MWRKVLPALAERHFVVAADLRGYGDSEKSTEEVGHDQGTKAADIRALIRHLGLGRAVIIGHDRGARVARRYALDYPEDVAGIALLDILPAEYVYDAMTSGEAARRFWHWTFHLVPELPERLVRGREEAYLERFSVGRPASSTAFAPTARLRNIVACFSSPALWRPRSRITGRPTIPTYHDTAPNALRASGSRRRRRFFGATGNLAGQPVNDIWSEVATDIRFAVEVEDCGHYLPEEQPEIVAEHLLAFADDRFENQPNHG